MKKAILKACLLFNLMEHTQMNYLQHLSILDTMKETMTHTFHTTATNNVRMLSTITLICMNAIQMNAIGKKYGRKT